MKARPGGYEGRKESNMIEKYRYRGRYSEDTAFNKPAGPWEYFDAYSDQHAKTEFCYLTGLSEAHGDGIEIQTWDEDLHCWMDITW